jgi:hypothetical protein
MNRTEHELELELMRLYLDGVASLEETQELESLIVKNASLRQDFLRYTHLDSALAGVHRSQPSLGAPRRSVWLSWRPLTAAAAGIVLGMFCTSVVFGYAVPRMRPDRQRVIPLFNEGFEDVNAVFGRGFPNDAGGWSGDFAAVVSADWAISPKEGQHMARLAPIAGRKFCAAECIVDLAKFPLISSTESRMVEVTASFHGMDSEWADRNQIRLAAFAEAPKDVKAIWNSDSRLDQVLLHLGRTVTVKPGEHGWQTLKVSMEIPTGARSLVIHLGAGVADDAGPKTLHYIDDVRAQFVITETTP